MSYYSNERPPTKAKAHACRFRVRRTTGARFYQCWIVGIAVPVGQSVWAIAAGYLGLFSVLCLPGPLALFCGIMAVREINRNPKKHGMGRAIFGIVMGTFGTLGTILIAIPLTIGFINGLNGGK